MASKQIEPEHNRLIGTVAVPSLGHLPIGPVGLTIEGAPNN